MKGVALVAGVAVLLGGCVPVTDVSKAPPVVTDSPHGAQPASAAKRSEVVPKPRPADLGGAAAQAVPEPKVFHVVAQALWDGRPSLGGVWVAAPNAEPRRVVIRNPANGRSVLGAVFPRETFYPGPPLQLSAEAAVALGLLPGQPAKLSVTAVKEPPVKAKK